MAIATTATFNPDVGDIIEEAFELCGQEARSGSDMRTARRSINYLTLEWANEGLNMWTMEEVILPSSSVIDGTATYEVGDDTISILDMLVRTDHGDVDRQNDIILQRISQNTYQAMPNKLDEGRPVQFVYNRDGVLDVTTGVNESGAFTLWPVPNETGKYTIVYWRMRRIADAGHAGNTMDIPDRFHPAFVYGLAYRLSVKIAPDRTSMLRAEYRDLFAKATEEDREKATFRAVPDLTGY